MTLFFSIFLAAGLWMTAFFGGMLWRGLEPWLWSATECDILESRAVQDTDSTSKPWRAAITYRYRGADGAALTSSRVAIEGSMNAGHSDDAGAIRRLVRQFPPGSRARCYVNRRDYGEAVLLLQAPWTGLFILFPLIFVAVGAGGAAAPWLPGRARSAPPRAPSERKSPSAWPVRMFCLVFVAVGAGLGYPFFVRPILKMIDAREWPAASCRIIRSEVVTNHDSDGDTHRAVIHFRYRVGAEEFDSTRYNFMGSFSSSGSAGKKEVVRRYPPGSEKTCFINPREPTEAVLERGPTHALWFGLIPSLFCVCGLIGFFNAKPAGGVAAPAVPGTTGVPGEPDAGAGVLKPPVSWLGKFLGIFAATVIWNGITIFMFAKGGDIPWFIKGIFAAVGLAVACGAVYQLLKLFSPRPILTVNRRAVPLGGTLQLDWRFTGAVRRIRRLRLFLQGCEEATYRRGTDTTTDKHVFTEIELLNETDSTVFAAGQASATIPDGSMHTFTAPNNKIVWTLHVKGDIPSWPNVDEEFVITVLPHERSSA